VIKTRLAPIAGVLVLAGAWEGVGRTQSLGGSIPSLTAVVRAIGDNLQLLLSATAATTAEAAVGGAIGLALGALLAALTAWFPRSHGHVVRSVVLINAIPVVAVGPILMSLPMRPAIPQVFAAVFVLFTTVSTIGDGFRAAPDSGRDLFAVFGAGPVQRFARLQVPTAVPFIADALRLGIPAAMLGAILGEWFGANSGLGVLMVSAMRNVQYELLWAACVMAVLVSVLGYIAGTAAERAASRFFGRPTTVSAAPGGGSRLVDAGLAILVPLVIIGCWQWWVSAGNVATVVAPSPHEVADRLWHQGGSFLRAAGVTLTTAGVGLALGAALGLSLALVSTLFTPVRSFLSPLVVLIPTIPIAVFIPVMGSMLSYGRSAIVASCVLMTFFPVFVITVSGLASRPAGSDDLFRVYGTNRFVTLGRLAFPSSLPSLFLALRLSAANCVLTAIAAEWLMDTGGLGKTLSDDQVTIDNAGTWAVAVVAVVMSVLVYRVAVLGERWGAARWG
jgi:ABC-type nitrate/sulfonate/bicarbonate transport system permease component